jgi:phenylacetate-CoA ligase
MSAAPLSPELPRTDPEHEAHAVVAVARAFSEIPFYEKLGRTPPAPGTPLDVALAGIPLLFKKDVRATLPKQWVPKGRDARAELASGDIELVETSGSTAERLRILWDKGWWLRQEARAMRTNAAVAALMDGGGGGTYREAILTTPACGLGTCHTGDLSYDERLDGHFLFLNMRQDPTYWRPEDMTRMLDELARHRTVGLESDPMYLAALARHATSLGRKIDVAGFCQLTYAFTTRASVRAIQAAATVPIVQLYGASEVGVLFMEGEDGRLHHAPFTTHVELLKAKVPTPGATDVAMVVVTSMDRVAQPLVRFVVGDLVQVDRAAAKRFTTVPPLVSVEGRVDDALVRPDGALVTAGALDRALGAIEPIELWQANQRRPDLLEIDFVASATAGAMDLAGEVRAQLAALLPGVEVAARSVTGIAAEPSGKFRVSKRHFPLDLSRAFEGCESVRS